MWLELVRACSELPDTYYIEVDINLALAGYEQEREDTGHNRHIVILEVHLTKESTWLKILFHSFNGIVFKYVQ